MQSIIQLGKSTLSAVIHTLLFFIIAGAIYSYFSESPTDSYSLKINLPKQVLPIHDFEKMQSAISNYKPNYSDIYKKAETLGIDPSAFKQAFRMKITTNIDAQTTTLNGLSITFFSPVENKSLEESYVGVLKDLSQYLDDYSKLKTIETSDL